MGRRDRSAALERFFEQFLQDPLSVRLIPGSPPELFEIQAAARREQAAQEAFRRRQEELARQRDQLLARQRELSQQISTQEPAEDVGVRGTRRPRTVGTESRSVNLLRQEQARASRRTRIESRGRRPLLIGSETGRRETLGG